jgi:hypothetical protein
LLLQVAAIRAVHEYHHQTAWEQFVKFMRRHKWTIGIVVALAVWLVLDLHAFRWGHVTVPPPVTGVGVYLISKCRK